MKKIVCSILLIAFLSSGVTAAAANKQGGVAGKYYYTDIVTYFYGAPITSYNLNGKTAIVCEDLNWHYNHNVYWREAERTLTVDKKNDTDWASLQAEAGETVISQNGKTGSAAGSIYYTDIKTYLNGRLINSYNIGGRTVIICEDMREYGYNVVWNEKERRLDITGNSSNFIRNSDIGEVKEVFGVFEVGGGTLSDYQLVIDGQRIDLETPYCIDASFITWVPVSSVLDALDVTYEWDSSEGILTVNSTDISFAESAVATEDKQIKWVEIFEYIDFRLYCGDREIPLQTSRFTGMAHTAQEKTFALNPILYDGVVYVPISVIADCFGYELDETQGLVSPRD